MSTLSRRATITGAFGSIALTAACGNGVGSNGANKIDANVTSSLNYLESDYPATRELRDKSVGLLVMPRVTEATFGFGGAYGRGSLLVNDIPVDYYSAAEGSFGFQIGAQSYSHILFFMTEDALADFRSASGWSAGGDIFYALANDGEFRAADTVTTRDPVIAVVFGQTGLIAGASLQGTKYTRIIP